MVPIWKKKPLEQVANFGYSSSKFEQYLTYFVKIGKFERFGAILLKLMATTNLLSYFWSRLAFKKLDLVLNSENGILLQIIFFGG